MLLAALVVGAGAVVTGLVCLMISVLLSVFRRTQIASDFFVRVAVVCYFGGLLLALIVLGIWALVNV